MAIKERKISTEEYLEKTKDKGSVSTGTTTVNKNTGGHITERNISVEEYLEKTKDKSVPISKSSAGAKSTPVYNLSAREKAETERKQTRQNQIKRKTEESKASSGSAAKRNTSTATNRYTDASQYDEQLRENYARQKYGKATETFDISGLRRDNNNLANDELYTRGLELANKKTALTDEEKKEAKAIAKGLKNSWIDNIKGFFSLDYSRDKNRQAREAVAAALETKTKAGSAAAAGLFGSMPFAKATARRAASFTDDLIPDSGLNINTIEAAQQNSPISYAIGEGAGDIAQLMGISGAVSAAGKGITSAAPKVGSAFMGLNPILRNAFTGAQIFGIKGAADALNKTYTESEWNSYQQELSSADSSYTPKEYSVIDQIGTVGKGYLEGVASGAAGGAAKSLVSGAMRSYLLKHGLMTPLNNVLENTLSSFARTAASTGAKYAVEGKNPYLQYETDESGNIVLDENGNPKTTINKAALAKDLAVTTIWSLIYGMIDAHSQSSQADTKLKGLAQKAQAQYEAVAASTDYASKNEQIDALKGVINDIRNEVGKTYYPGGQARVNAIYEGLDAIDARLNELYTTGGAGGSSSFGYGLGDMAPVIGAGAPETDMQIRYTAMPEQERPTENTSDNIPVMENTEATTPDSAMSLSEEEAPTEAQAEVSEAVTENGIPEDTKQTTEAIPAESEKILREYAAGAGFGEKGAKAIEEAYDGGVPLAGYSAAFTAYYNAGREGKTIEEVKTKYGGGATENQKKIAYNAGRMDAIKAEGKEVKTVEEISNKPYNGIKTADELRTRLTSYDKAEADGITYEITGGERGYSTAITNKQTEIMNGAISDARATIYSGGPFKTRDEALNDLMDIAENPANNLLPKEAGANGGGLQTGGLRNGRGLRNGELGEVSDGEGIPVASALGQGSSGVLDGVSSEYVPGNAERRYAAEEPYEGGGNSGGVRGGIGTQRSGIRRSEGNGLGESTRTSAGAGQPEDGRGGTQGTTGRRDGVSVQYGPISSGGDNDIRTVQEKAGVHSAGEKGAGMVPNSGGRKASEQAGRVPVGETGDRIKALGPVSGGRNDGGNELRGIQQDTGEHSGGKRNVRSGTEVLQGDVGIRDTGVLSNPKNEAENEPQKELSPEQLNTDKEQIEIENEQTIVSEEVKKKEELACPAQNYVFPKEGLKLPNGEKARYKANVQAIKILKTVLAEGRKATPEEQAELALYVGWGGLPNVFNEADKKWSKEFKELKGLLTEDEYKAAKASTLNAHYTSYEVIEAMYNGLLGIGFTGGRILEPSCGTGNFAGAMPGSIRNGVKGLTMVELDNITGGIAGLLYPNADVRIQGFEESKLPDNYFDLAIGNVPFGNYGIFDKAYPKAVTGSIHNYFFAKSLDKVRPGGILCFITSRYTMDAQNSGVRKYIMERADLLGAIRLPDSAFKGNAGTEVVTDILILKKRKPGTPYTGEAFQGLQNRYVQNGNIYLSENEYFNKHPEMVLGTAERGKMYARDSVTYKALPGSLGKQIVKAFKNIKTKMDYPAVQTPEEIRRDIKKIGKGVKNGSITVKNGKFYENRDGQAIATDRIKEKDTARMTGILKIRDVARDLLNAQLEGRSDEEIKALRKNLNEAYDTFTAKYGALFKNYNKRLIKLDADSAFILSLENVDDKQTVATKADIFKTNTVSPVVTITHTETYDDALAVSVNETGGVDIGRIASLMSEEPKTVKKELMERRLIFKNRDGGFETAQMYLSGNVKAKLKDAEALAEADPDYKTNIEELKKIIPKDIEPEDIKVRPGMTWIPASLYADFAAEMLGMPNRARRNVDIKYNAISGTYDVATSVYINPRSPENISIWGTSSKNCGFIQLFTALLNNKSVVVKKKVGDQRVTDKQATAAAQEKQEKIKERFNEWLWEDEERRNTIAKLYNDTFNCIVTPKYDGSKLTVNGANPLKPLRPHQKNAVARIIMSGGNTLLAHKVGAGKTYEMAAAAMKMRQLGIVKKPLFVVPKSLTSQWGKEFLDFFPAANILVLGDNDFSTQNRREYANRIAVGNYDAVIISYEQFGMMPMDIEYRKAFYQEQIDEITAAIAEERAKRGREPQSVKNMESQRKQLEADLNKLGSGAKDEDNINFEELGVDALFVDEAHNYKNLFFKTNMSNMSGLGSPAGNKRTLDMYMKVRYLQKLNGGRGIVFATATPVMNSMSEMYIMQKYLQNDMLEAAGLGSFDAWANQFGEVRTVLEMTPEGKGYRQKQCFSKFKNLAELQMMFRSFADVLTEIEGLKIPKMKDGKRIVIECEPSLFQMEYINKLAERAEAVRNGNVDPKDDNMLKITSEGRKLSYTQRMIDPSLPYEEGCKIIRCADNAIQIYKETENIKGTQLIFCDLATPKGRAKNGADTAAEDGETESISVYDDIKNRLMAGGIPAEEIAFIHDANNENKRKALFDAMNEGRVRILIGSTGKMGVGMNAQKRMAAIHHLDAPWRPGDIEQREGRGLRQGNINDEVGIYVYVTKKTFDSRMWDNLQRKASFIHQIMAGDLTAREAEGDGDFALSAAEIKAISSGDPLIMEQFEVAAEVTRLESLERAHNKAVSEAKSRIKEAEKQLINAEQNLKKTKADIKRRVDTSGEKFIMNIDGKAVMERKTAGSIIISDAKGYFRPGTEAVTEAKAGQFAGFDLYITTDNRAVLKGSGTYSITINTESPLGTIQALEGAVRKLDTIASNLENSILENKRSIPKFEKAAEAEFDKKDELMKLRLRAAEIAEELNPEENAAAGLEEEPEDSINRFIDTGGKRNGRKEDNDRKRRHSMENIRKQVAVGTGNRPLDDREGNGGGSEQGGSREGIRSTDSEGRRISGEAAKKLKGTAVTDSNGRPLAVYHATNKVFDKFTIGDVGFHFGTHGQAEERANNLKYEKPIYIRAYLNIKNPAVLRRDPNGWHPHAAALTLWNEDYITFEEYQDIYNLWISGDREGAKRLFKETMQRYGYDGIAYDNGFEGKGTSYIAFDDSQIIRAPIETKENAYDNLEPHPERWETERVGGKREVKPISSIIADIQHDFGLNITTGHIRGAGVRGQYNDRDKGIRTKIANDLPTTAHELGHALNSRYGILDSITKNMASELTNGLSEDMKEAYDKKLWESEGLAEFVRKFLQNRETAAIDYPEFTKHFLNSMSGKDRALITNLADDINAYYSLDADTATSSIKLKEEKSYDPRTGKEKASDKLDELYQQWVDRNHGIKKFDNAVGSDVYKLATNAAYADAVAGSIITGDLYDVDGKYMGTGLKTALKGINLNDKKEYKLFAEYLITKHGPERLAEGMRVYPDDRKNSTSFMERRSAELEEQYPEFKAAAERLYDFQRRFKEVWGVNTGLIPKEMSEFWDKRWQYYVPFNRDMKGKKHIGAKRGFANQSNPAKRANDKGSGRDIIHPVDSIINNICIWVSAGMRNNVMVHLRNTALDMKADATFMEKVPTPMTKRTADITGIKKELAEVFKEKLNYDTDKDIAVNIINEMDSAIDVYGKRKAHDNEITVMINGEPEYWKVNDPLLLDSIAELSPKQMPALLEAYAKTTRLMAMMATGANPLWSIFSNAPRDLQTLFTMSGDKNPAHLITAIASSYVNAYNSMRGKDDKLDPLYREYIAMGGSRASAYAADANLAKKARKELSRSHSPINDFNPIRLIGFIANMVENGPRFATYKLMRQSGMKPYEAFYEAMDITVNFRRSGKKSKMTNMVVLFFNANLQGIDKAARWITAEDARGKDRLKTVKSRIIGYATASIILGTMIYAINNRNKEAREWYQKLSPYQKNNYYVFYIDDGKFFKISKGQVITIPVSFVSALLDYKIGGNKHAFDDFGNYIIDAAAPPVASDLLELPLNGFDETLSGAAGSLGVLGTLFYAGANRDFRGRPIVSEAMQALENKDQYTGSTSKVAYWVGQAFNRSPMMMDFLADSLLGGVQDVNRALLPMDDERRDYTLGIKNTYVADALYSQDAVNRLYDKAESSNRKKNSDKTNMDKAITAKMDSNMTSFYSNYNKLSKNEPETTETRIARKAMLDMICEYLDAAEEGKASPTEEAVYKLCRAKGDAGYLPQIMPITVKDADDNEYELSGAQYIKYQTNYNTLYWKYIEDNGLTDMTIDETEALVISARRIAKERATEMTLKEVSPTATTGYFEKYGNVNDEDIIEFVKQYELMDEEGDGQLKQEEVIEILETMIDEGLSYEDAYSLFHAKYPRSDKNNPYRAWAM